MKKCRVCSAKEVDVEFVHNANICKTCNTEYMKNYRRKNKHKIAKQIKDWKDTNREQYQATTRDHYHNRGGKAQLKARYEKNPRIFLSKQLSGIRSRSKKPGPHDPKDPNRRMWDIDIDYVMDLWESQNGCCALTGISMIHKFGELKSVSIDRIDPEQGHVKGNIQLVCKFINIGKRNHTNADMLAIIEELRK